MRYLQCVSKEEISTVCVKIIVNIKGVSYESCSEIDIATESVKV